MVLINVTAHLILVTQYCVKNNTHSRCNQILFNIHDKVGAEFASACIFDGRDGLIWW